MAYHENEIRHNLRRCSLWLDIFIDKLGCERRERGPESSAAVAHACRQVVQEAIEFADGSATTKKLLAVLERCIPWMCAAIDGGYTRNCSTPQDAVLGLNEALRMVYPDAH